MVKSLGNFCTTSGVRDGSQAEAGFIPNQNPTVKTNVKSIVVALCSAALCGTAGARPPEHAGQPEMNGAIVQLDEAKHARHPIEHLESAKHELEDAKHNKHGERVEAIRHVTEAIEAARKHEHKAMEAHIDAAIHEVREGRHAARK